MGNFGQLEREKHITKLCIKEMLTFMRPKLLGEPETTTTKELCTKVEQKLILRDLFPLDDWSRDGFNEMSTDASENILVVLTKRIETQISPEERLNTFTEKISQPEQGTSTQNTS